MNREQRSEWRQLEFLDNNWVRETCLLNCLSQITKKLGRESHHLKMIIRCPSRPRCIDEGANVIDCMVVIKMCHHAGTIDQSKLNGGWRQCFIHNQACGRCWSRVECSGSNSWLRCHWNRAATKSSPHTLKWNMAPLWFLHEIKYQGHELWKHIEASTDTLWLHFCYTLTSCTLQ